MTTTRTITVHEIATDGLPPRKADDPERYDQLIGCVAFIFDGCIVSGWPLYSGPDYDELPYSGHWEANDDVGRNVEFAGVTHWVEFDAPLWEAHTMRAAILIGCVVGTIAAALFLIVSIVVNWPDR